MSWECCHFNVVFWQINSTTNNRELLHSYSTFSWMIVLILRRKEIVASVFVVWNLIKQMRSHHLLMRFNLKVKKKKVQSLEAPLPSLVYLLWENSVHWAADFTRYPLLLGGQRQHRMRSLPDTSTHDQQCESNPTPLDSGHMFPQSNRVDYFLATVTVVY